ncbi:aminoalcoholphosphotransferase 1 [Prunus dulcis]|uniref:Aminoalcoholphosphotransferase 1 n=1 Tax=Prunus dulcis TaxID=3755 RepID=A0A4Y1RZP8_PRUDU|nr:aminoalcoholphosphotransferase 1 [Prunus dulcis]
MGPNMITLTGFMFLLTSALLGYIYSPRLDSAPPRWTFDAVDGKQARRTDSSSPLGELFDHGCDALACAFEGLAFGVLQCVEELPSGFGYFTNTLILPAVNGPTEGLMLIYLSHFFTAIVGSEWWAQQFGKSLPFLSWVPFIHEITTYKAVLFLMVAFAVIPTVTFNVCNVYKVVQARKASMLLALAMGSMILAHLCDEPKGLKTGMCMSLLYLPFAIANALTARLNDGVPSVDESLVLLGYCAFTGTIQLSLSIASTEPSDPAYIMQ